MEGKVWYFLEKMQGVPRAIRKNTLIRRYDYKWSQGRMGGNHLEKDRLNTQLLQFEMLEPWEGEVAAKKHKRWVITQNNSVGYTVQVAWKHSIIGDGFFEEEKWVRVEGDFAWSGYQFGKEQATAVLIMIVASIYVI